MFNRIPMDIIHVPVEIIFIPDQMIPKAMLPKRTLLSLASPGVQPFRAIQTFPATLRNDPFNDAPARRKIGIIWRQTPDAMQMIGQKHPGNDFERLGLPGELNPFAQCRADIVIDQETLPPERNHREKIHPARRINASIIRHNNIRRACRARQSG